MRRTINQSSPDARGLLFSAAIQKSDGSRQLKDETLGELNTRFKTPPR
jgi:hypothetical protein